ncbi:calcium-binding protein [Pseudaestuariivita sp.]|uniref:calcium-binding protein n=1 Tax=Pseudaestuariivita sp. TaxID=2211669 RepID=UPI00405A4A2F
MANFDDVSARFVFENYPSVSLEGRVELAIQQGYETSFHFQSMIDIWAMNNPGSVVYVRYEPGELKATQGQFSDGNHYIWIDPEEIDRRLYINDEGTAYIDSDIVTVGHELIHALLDLRDLHGTARSDDLKGDTLREQFLIEDSLGLANQASYDGWAFVGDYIEEGVNYSLGRPVDEAWLTDNSVTMSLHAPSNDLLMQKTPGARSKYFDADAGDDTMYGFGGDDTLDGGSGEDTAVFSGNPSDYDVQMAKDGTWVVDHVRGAADEGTNRLSNVEKIHFRGTGETFDLRAEGMTFQSDILFLADISQSVSSIFMNTWAEAARAIMDATSSDSTRDVRTGVTLFYETPEANETPENPFGTDDEPELVVLPQDLRSGTDLQARLNDSKFMFNELPSFQEDLVEPEPDYFDETIGEDVIEAAIEAVKTAQWRIGAADRKVIVFTDAPPKDVDKLPELISVLNSRSVEYFQPAIDPGTGGGGGGGDGGDGGDGGFDGGDGGDGGFDGGDGGFDGRGELNPAEQPNIGPGDETPETPDTFGVQLVFVAQVPQQRLDSGADAGAWASFSEALDDAGITFLAGDALYEQDNNYAFSVLTGMYSKDPNIDVGDGSPGGGGFTHASPVRGTQDDDVIDGMNYAETIYGLDGDDTIYAHRSTFPDVANGQDWIEGNAGNDVIFGSIHDDTLLGGAGNDTVKGDLGFDLMEGGEGYDRARYDVPALGNLGIRRDGDDFIVLSIKGEDTLRGFEEITAETRVQPLSDNPVFGTDGNDSLEGETSPLASNVGLYDVFHPGLGFDTIDGGPGRDLDRVVIDVNSYNATITRVNDATSVVSSQGTKILYNVEHIDFLDRRVAIDGEVQSTGATDDLLTGTPGADVLDAGGGNDTILGLEGDDVIEGGTGDDSITDGAGLDTINGGEGFDTLVKSFATEYPGQVIDPLVEIWAGLIRDEESGGRLDEFSSIEQFKLGLGEFIGIEVVGSPDAEDIRTGDGGDLIEPWGGNDTLRTNGGDDTVRAGDGNNLIFLGAGDDEFRENFGSGFTGDETVYGGLGDDFISGFRGADELFGQGGDDTILASNDGGKALGGAGDDSLGGGSGADFLDGGADNDQLTGWTGNDTLEGGDGADSLAGEEDNDLLVGGNGLDSLLGGDGDDTLLGNAGADTLEGGVGSDSIAGGTHGDMILAGQGADTVVGGNGADEVRLGAGGDLFQDNTQGGAAGRDTVFGGAGEDTLQGGGGNDVLHGEDNADTINGRGGSDTITGGSGSDVIDAGNGADSVEGGDGADRVSLGNGADVYRDTAQTGAAGADIVQGGNGTDQISGGGGNDELFGNAGADNLFGGSGADTIKGGSGADYIEGNGGADSIEGGRGPDTVRMGAGADVYTDDAQTGVLGNDTITGGAGADTFIFGAQVANEVITDFEIGVDELHLSNAWVIGATPLAAMQQMASIGVGTGGIVISNGMGQSILLEGETDLVGLVDDVVLY